MNLELSCLDTLVLIEVLKKVKYNLKCKKNDRYYRENYEKWLLRLDKEDYERLGKIITRIGG